MTNEAFDHTFFTPKLKEELEKLHKASLQSEFVTDNASNVLLRTSQSSIQTESQTFTFQTSADPQDVIKYTSTENTVFLPPETTN